VGGPSPPVSCVRVFHSPLSCLDGGRSCRSHPLLQEERDFSRRGRKSKGVGGVLCSLGVWRGASSMECACMGFWVVGENGARMCLLVGCGWWDRCCVSLSLPFEPVVWDAIHLPTLINSVCLSSPPSKLHVSSSIRREVCPCRRRERKRAPRTSRVLPYFQAYSAPSKGVRLCQMKVIPVGL